MADYAAPTGPPPPRVPEGWKAIWNDQYKEWFFVNIHTKQSTWEKPTEPAYPSHSVDGPPSYTQGHNAVHDAVTNDDKKYHLESNNPYSHGGGQSHENDEQLARRLQEEENARRNNPHGVTGTDRGTSDSYYQSNNAQSAGHGQTYQQQQGIQGGYPGAPDYNNQQNHSTSSSDRAKSGGGGLFGKLKDKLANPSSGSRPMGAPMMGYSAGGYPSQRHGYPQQGMGGYGGGGYPQQGYGGYPQQGMGYGQPMYGGQMMGQQRQKQGMGAGGAAALGVGGGLLGGMMLANAMDDDDYQEGYEDGQDNGGGDDGGDMGGD